MHASAHFPESPKTVGLPFPQVLALLSEYLKQFLFAPHFEEQDIRHWFLPAPLPWVSV